MKGKIQQENVIYESFTNVELTILRIVQSDLSHSLTPYADIAASAGTDEQTVITFLKKLKKNGRIRRFGASIRHQRMGYSYNMMVAWKVDDAHKDKAGAIAAAQPTVSHCYFRPTSAPDWPYTLYTMIHGKTREECMDTINALQSASPMFAQYKALTSLKELKKISPSYF